MILLIVFALISIVISFLCSIMEAAILSLTPSYIAQLKDTRPRLHNALSALKKDIDRPLAAILTLNTVAHTVGATGVGAQVTALFGETYIGVASAVMTLLILILSEIIPKTIGANYWRGLAPLLPVMLKPMIWVLSPFIWLSEIITRRISRQTNDVDLRSEISTMARIGLEEKTLEKDETRTIVNILNLHEISISEAMTPRTVCETVSATMKVSEFDEHYSRMQFTRFPVMGDDEHAVGYIHKADTYHADPDSHIEQLMRPVTDMQETDSVEKVFTTMLKEHNHLSVVYDDNGTWVGLITMEDVFETILGQDIVDETDHVQNLRKYARLRWLKRARRQNSP